MDTFDPPPPHELTSLLKGYEVADLIACGGMGAVYRASQVSLHRDVAIKVLPRELSAQEEFEESFKAEARVMAKLTHVNLIGVFDFGEVDGMLYLVMEFVDGQSLHDVAHGQVVDPIQAVEIIKETAKGLGHAHEHDVLHRDIKPANVLLSTDLQPKLGDFGLAVPIDEVATGLQMGTPGYAAPEVIENFESATPASDTFSLGMILHQLLTGIDPTVEPHVELESVPALRGLHSVVQKATSTHPSTRYQDGTAMADALEEWLTAAKRAPGNLLTGAGGGASLSALQAPGAMATPTMESASRGGAGKLVGGIAAALVIGVVGFKFFGPTPEEPETPGTAPVAATKEDPSPAPNLDDPPASPPKFDLAAHKAKSLLAIDEARTDLLDARRDNLRTLGQRTESDPKWQAYFDLVDPDRLELPRELPDESTLVLDDQMAALLNEFAQRGQGSIDRQSVNRLRSLHRESITTLKSAGVDPDSDVVRSWERWIEWLGRDPLEVLALSPTGTWKLESGPPAERGLILSILPDDRVEIRHEEFEVEGTLTRTPEGSLRITHGKENRSWDLRWRQSALQGEDEAGTAVRFRRATPRFTPTAPDPEPPPALDPEFARFQTDYQGRITEALDSFVASYLRRMEAEAEKARKRGLAKTAEQIQAEIARVEKLDWQSGLIAPDAVQGDNPLPTNLQELRKRFGEKLSETLSEKQPPYTEALQVMRQRHAEEGKDTTAIDRSISQLLRVKTIDLSAFTNVSADGKDWHGPGQLGINGAAENLRSAHNVNYDVSGIIQLNSGIMNTPGRPRLNGSDVATYYEKDFPDAVKAIPVGRSAQEIYVISAAIWGQANAGDPVAFVVLNFDDGESARLPLRSRQHIGEWNRGKELPESSVAWRGHSHCVYEVVLKNPSPGKTIKTIDLESGKARAAPFFLALTVR